MADRNLQRRFTDFGIAAIRFAKELPDEPTGYNSKRQLIKCATSVGANYREAQSSRTKAEFTSKAQISLQEANECQHWLETIITTLPRFAKTGNELLAETREITAILTATVRTAKSRPNYRGVHRR